METKYIVTIVTLVCITIIWIIFIGFYSKYAEALKGNPIAYGAKRFELDCVCTSEKLPGSMMMVDRYGNVTYSYPERPKTFEVNISQLEGNITP